MAAEVGGCKDHTECGQDQSLMPQVEVWGKGAVFLRWEKLRDRRIPRVSP